MERTTSSSSSFRPKHHQHTSMETITMSDEIKDHISELPSCVLGYIVSFLTMKDAVKTSILSRRWRYLYAERLHLNLDPFDILSTDDQDKEFQWNVEEFEKEKFEFLTRADHIVRLFHGKRIISFRVDFFLDNSCSSYLDKWISTAIDSGVEELELPFFLDDDFKISLELGAEYQYNFPYWLFSSRLPRNRNMLKHLHLRECVMKAPGDFHGFSNLRTLELQRVVLAEGFVTNLFFNCPQLEDLTLEWCRVLSRLRVVGPSLRLIHLKVLSSDLLIDEISAENLTTFKYSGNVMKICPFQAPRLEKMSCTVDNIYDLEKFVKFPQLNSLDVSYRQLMERFPESTDAFRNLRHFYLIGWIALNFNLSGILSILKAAPLLQKLQIVLRMHKHHENREDIEQRECGIVHDELKEFAIHACLGNWYEIELAKIVLRAATKLEHMVIISSMTLYAGNGDIDDLRKSFENSVMEKLQNYIPAGVQLIIF